MSIYLSGNEKETNRSKNLSRVPAVPSNPFPKPGNPHQDHPSIKSDVAQRDAEFQRKVAEGRARIEKGQAYRGNDLIDGIRSK